MTDGYDLAVIGAGIVGLAHAWAAARRGLRVVVIDRDVRANGASIRNFGFVTVTGQQAGDCWEMARRTRDAWLGIAEAARIPVLQRGLILAARHPEAEDVIEAFLKTPAGAECRRLSLREARERIPALREDRVRAALHSPHEIRVESRTALPLIADWLSESFGVTFLWGCAVSEVAPPRIVTGRGTVRAEAAICCPGDDTRSLFGARLAGYGIGRTKLQMLRLRPERPIRMDCALMSDLGLARYRGYADLPEARPLARRLEADQPLHVAHGVHLIAVRSADGSLVVGDSHEESQTPDPFLSDAVNRLILDEFEAVVDIGSYSVEENWAGTYAKADGRWRVTDAPDPAIRVVIVTAGCGASTAFGIAEETVGDLYGREAAE